MSNLDERIHRMTRRHPTLNSKAKLAEHLGCSRSMLHNYENETPPPPQVILDKLVALEVTLGIDDRTDVQAAPSVKRRRLDTRLIPVVGMAHAGEATSYEELPCDPEDYVPTECRDNKAFAVRLEGESMEPDFRERDLLILMPETPIYSNCLAVLRLANDGVVFRRIEIRGETIRLVPLNPRYPVDEIPTSQVKWAYPVFGMWRQIAQ